MRKSTFCLAVAIALAVPTWAQQPPQTAPATAPATATAPAGTQRAAAAATQAESDVVQLAILLDTSGSMNGLINQAKAQLWEIVNQIAKAQVEGQRPDIQVALYQYGSPSLGAETGFIKQLVPLTDNLDKVSAELFKLTTSGGEEYCGMVIKKAVEELKWTDEKGAYKAIFVAGNEAFNQGTVDFHAACKEAITKGIVVHTIFCGPEQTGISTNWKEGATAGEGTYNFIDQNSRVARAAAPQDKQLAELSAKLNSTYIPYGKEGKTGAANQAAQDANAGGLGGAALSAERAITKANAVYRNSTWDLVDAVNGKKVTLADLKPEDLPEEMRAMDLKAREDYLAAKTKERQDIQGQIKSLSEDRDKYIASITPPAAARGAAGGAGAGGRGAGGAGGAGGGGGRGGFGGAVGGAAAGRAGGG